MDDDDVRERVYSLPTVAGGAALLAVLGAIIAAVIGVSQSSAGVVHRRTLVAVPPVSTAVVAPSTAPVTQAPEVLQFFGVVQPLPLFGQVLPPV